MHQAPSAHKDSGMSMESIRSHRRWRKRVLQMGWLMPAAAALAARGGVAEASGFPGTIKPQQPPSNQSGSSSSQDWWQPKAPASSDDEGESSSDWEDWDEQDLQEESFATLPASPGATNATTAAVAASPEPEQSASSMDSATVADASDVAASQNPPPPDPVAAIPAAVPESDETPRTRSSPDPPTNQKPLQTLEKLQQMLDETDYLTTSRGAGRHSQHPPAPPAATVANTAATATEESEASTEVAAAAAAAEAVARDTLWTSRDRSKYKKTQQQQSPAPGSSATSTSASYPPPQQRLIQDFYDQQPQQPPPPPVQNQAQHSPPPQRPRSSNPRSNQWVPPPAPPSFSNPYETSGAFTSDADEISDTDDGLGYTLPNLPIYFSDDEGDLSATDGTTSTTTTLGAAKDAAAAYAEAQPHAYPTGYPYGAGGTAGNYYGTPPYPGYPLPPPPQYATPQQLQQYYAYLQQVQQHLAQQQQQQIQQPPAPTQPAGGPPPPIPPNPMAFGPPPPYFYPRPVVPSVDGMAAPPRGSVRPGDPPLGLEAVPEAGALVVSEDAVARVPFFRVTLDSMSKLATCMVLAAVVCYSAVSPRNLPFVEHNQKFYRILRISSLTTVPPLLLSALVIQPSENHKTSLSTLVHAFFCAFTMGYAGIFALQIMAATLVRLAVFLCLEPSIFDMTPQVPLLVVPWVLREQQYLVKPITLLAQDVVVSAVVSPLIEEFVKLRLLQWTIPLGKNFKWVKKPSKKSKKKKKTKRAAEAIDPGSGTEKDDGSIVNVNHYLTGMLAVSLGVKLADSIRRVCMYTKAGDLHQGFYALCRGIFPIHELCGTMTALALARRDVLGQKTPTWKLLLPAAVIHGMANFRGMKPVFKWNSATPWSEMQLSPEDLLVDPATGERRSLGDLAAQAFPKLMWLILLARVAGYCGKNYYMINRHALKRTTTYAGKHSAFSAELAAAEMLKKKDKKNQQQSQQQH